MAIKYLFLKDFIKEMENKMNTGRKGSYNFIAKKVHAEGDIYFVPQNSKPKASIQTNPRNFISLANYRERKKVQKETAQMIAELKAQIYNNSLFT